MNLMEREEQTTAFIMILKALQFPWLTTVKNLFFNLTLTARRPTLVVSILRL